MSSGGLPVVSAPNGIGLAVTSVSKGIAVTVVPAGSKPEGLPVVFVAP